MAAGHDTGSPGETGVASVDGREGRGDERCETRVTERVREARPAARESRREAPRESRPLTNSVTATQPARCVNHHRITTSIKHQAIPMHPFTPSRPSTASAVPPPSLARARCASTRPFTPPALLRHRHRPSTHPPTVRVAPWASQPTLPSQHHGSRPQQDESVSELPCASRPRRSTPTMSTPLHNPRRHAATSAHDTGHPLSIKQPSRTTSQHRRKRLS